MRIESVRNGASGTTTVAAGGSFFTVELELLEELGLPSAALSAGSELDEEQAGLLALAAEAREAEKRGLSLVARAEQSAFMLERKLDARGFSTRSIRIALGRLESKRFLDDRRFALAYAASRLAHRGSKAEGPSSLAAALRERGIDRNVAAEAIAELLGPEDRAAALKAAADRLIARAGRSSRAYRGGRSADSGEGSADSGEPRDEIRRRLRELGYRSEEIREYFESR